MLLMFINALFPNMLHEPIKNLQSLSWERKYVCKQCTQIIILSETAAKQDRLKNKQTNKKYAIQRSYRCIVIYY